jgi:catechol 2,3-dioxygenase-like lactoylglutathione lyase family enzyme
MIVMPIVYVSDMVRSVAFYRALGCELLQQGRTGQWTELQLNGSRLALHQTTSLPEEHCRVELSLVSNTPLEDVVAELKRNGIRLEREIEDVEFGRSLSLRDPDGMVIQVLEQDPELYT